MKKKEIGNNNLLMSLNKRIGNKKVIVVISVIVFFTTFLAGNFFINLLFYCQQQQLGKIFNLQNLYKIQFEYLSDHNVLYIFYIALLIIDVFHTCTLAYRIYTSYSDMNIGQKGTSRWTTTDEIKEQYKEVPDKDKSFPGYGGIPVARIENKLYIDDTNTNSLVLGITRSGKGEMFVVPCIDLYSRGAEKASMVVLDMKMELICRSYTTLVERGYDVEFLNIQDPSMGIQYNPLELIVKYYLQGNKADAELLCNSFAYSIYSGKGSNNSDNTEFFLNNATSALSALIIAHIEDCNAQDMRENAKCQIEFMYKQNIYSQLTDVQKKKELENWLQNKPEMFTYENIKKLECIPDSVEYEYTRENIKKVTVPSIVNTFTELARVKVNSTTTQLDIYFQKRPAGDRAKAIYSSIELAGGEKTKGSIFSQALTKLNIYMYENITKLTAKSTFDIENIGFGEKPVALFIGVPFYDRSKDSIVSTLISQVFQANARRAAVAPGQKCKRRIIFQLDEIGNYPAIMDFKSMISVGLGCNMIFNLFLQDYNQMDSTYGDDAKTIKANVGNQVYIQTSSYDTAKEFSDLLGPETITNITRTGKKMELSKSFTEMYDERPLLSANELMNLMPGENVIKRVMKRTDLKGGKVVPYPILNSIGRGTDYLFSYEYLGKSFPSGKSLLDIALPRVDSTGLTGFFNYNYTMNKFAYEYIEEIINSGNEETIDQLTPDQLGEYEMFKRFYKFDKKLESIANGNAIINFVEKMNMKDVTTNTLVGDLVTKLCNNKEIKISDKLTILSLLK